VFISNFYRFEALEVGKLILIVCLF